MTAVRIDSLPHAMFRTNAVSRDRPPSCWPDNPFYLQLFGEALPRGDPPYEQTFLKEALSELLFERRGARGRGTKRRNLSATARWQDQGLLGNLG